MLCKNCNSNESVKYSKYSNGEFCSKECAKSFSTKNKRKEINEKVGKKLKGYKHSDEMKKKLSINNGSHNLEVRNKIKNTLVIFYKSEKGLELISRFHTGKTFSEETRKKISNSVLERCKDINERIRLREIGRKGGFGKKGYTEKGTRFESFLEKQCFEYLENININFVPHKGLPESSKVCDIYLPDKDLWIELDGINREKRKKYLGKDYDYWLEKLKQYKEKELKYEIFYTYEDFVKFFEKIFGEVV